MQIFLEKHYKKIIFIILFFMFSVSALNAWNDSAIFDETAHIGAAYTYVTQQEIRLNPEHPPLIKDLAGLPLLLLNLNFDVNQPFWTGSLPGKWDEGQWAAGRYLLYQAGNNPDVILFFSRLPIIILSLLLGWFIFRWVRELVGIPAGLLALALYAFDPNILGHNHYVTTDIGIAAFVTFAFYYYLKFIKYPTWKNIALAGLFVGFLLVAKFSFFVTFPIFGIATIIYPFVVSHSKETGSKILFRARKLMEYLGKGALVFSLALIVVWIVYAANTFNMSRETVARTIDANFSPAKTDNALNIKVNQALHQLNTNSLTRPLSEFGIGVGYVFRRVAGGNGAYFLGQVSSQAFPMYFPVVFSLKEPLPSLLLMLIALVITLLQSLRTFIRLAQNKFQGSWQTLSHFLRTSLAEWSLLGFLLLYAYVSITSNLNIGFRHLFPILTFIFILTAKKIYKAVEKKKFQPNFNETREELIQRIQKHEHNRKPLQWSFGAIMVYLILGTILAYPFYMSYFNEIAGGPKNGYRYVTDSNADWGQDLKRLRNFLDNNPDIGKIHVDYFGGGDIKTYIGDKYLIWWDSKRPIEPGWYAISTNFLMGSLYDKTKKDADSYRWLKNKEPTYQVGTSMLIYYVTPEEVTKL